MFTGIIEALGYIKLVKSEATNKTFWIEAPFIDEVKVDQSICHDGVCLTAEAIKNGWYQVTAIEETLKKTNLVDWKDGSVINLERSLLPSTRLDGHFVQGHVDATGVCQKIENRGGSYEFTFAFPEEFAALVIEKGSIAVNGISLTIFNVTKASFTVALIPYTWEHTNLNRLSEQMRVNLEFDMIGKYLLRKLSLMPLPQLI